MLEPILVGRHPIVHGVIDIKVCGYLNKTILNTSRWKMRVVTFCKDEREMIVITYVSKCGLQMQSKEADEGQTITDTSFKHHICIDKTTFLHSRNWLLY